MRDKQVIQRSNQERHLHVKARGPRELNSGTLVIQRQKEKESKVGMEIRLSSSPCCQWSIGLTSMETCRFAPGTAADCAWWWGTLTGDTACVTAEDLCSVQVVKTLRFVRTTLLTTGTVFLGEAMSRGQGAPLRAFLCLASILEDSGHYPQAKLDLEGERGIIPLRRGE